MNVPEWVEGVGRESVLCSRARLARNLSGVPFRGAISPQEARRFCERVLDSLKGLHPAFAPLADETSEELPDLVEAMRLPGNLLDPLDPGPWLALEDASRGVLALDGDHLRIWARTPGQSLPEALEMAGSLEALVREVMPLVRDPQFGWITASPMDAGTGLRASLLLHLPALCIAGRTTGFPEAMEAMGHALAGPWGGISEDDAGLFVLTHRRTIGLSEAEILEGLEGVASIFLREEENARRCLLQEWGTELEDAVARSASLLGSAHLLSRRELSARVRWLSVGARLGWVSASQARDAMEAHLRTGDRTLSRKAGSVAGELEGNLDEWRARTTAGIVRGDDDLQASTPERSRRDDA
jgi:protein arginine kinase